MTHSDYAFLAAVFIFIVAFVVSCWAKSIYGALVSAGLTAVALGLLLAP